MGNTYRKSSSFKVFRELEWLFNAKRVSGPIPWALSAVKDSRLFDLNVPKKDAKSGSVSLCEQRKNVRSLKFGQ